MKFIWPIMTFFSCKNKRNKLSAKENIIALSKSLKPILQPVLNNWLLDNNNNNNELNDDINILENYYDKMINEIIENEVNIYKSSMKTTRFYGRKPFISNNIDNGIITSGSMLINSNISNQEKKKSMYNNNNIIHKKYNNNNNNNNNNNDECDDEFITENDRRFRNNNQINMFGFKSKNEIRYSYESSTLGTRYF
ncbi:hypothetical protein Glove_51g81 [Diversispora epigaea]|uniref:Uncharacterized protein n=1 Tax=Diversispora epigaea TaxID=1348612 RepID=A0A397JFS5_9GLOM|nr:hypothetical protein Glove_51g81 [Diversispora epigaea]